MTTTLVQLTPKSSNSKTGPIPVSMSLRSTCPDHCSFKGTDENGKLRGCYAESWPLRTHWDAVEARGVDWDTFCNQIAKLPDGQLWRHNQAGDLPGDNNAIDWPAMLALVEANRGKQGFTYTHKPGAREALATVNRNGFTVNVSCDSLGQVDQEIAGRYGNPLVVVLPELEKGESEPKVTLTPDGNRVVTCPAQWRETSCAECKLCAVADRDYVIGFRAHGIAHRRVTNLVSAGSLNRKKPAKRIPNHFKIGREMVQDILPFADE
jgi:hypothetical protein